MTGAPVEDPPQPALKLKISDYDKTTAVYSLLRARYSPINGNGPRYVYAAEVRNRAGLWFTEIVERTP